VKYFFILLAFALFFSCHPGPRPKDAVRLNDSIISRQDTFYIKLDKLIELLGDEAKYEIVYDQYLEVLQYAKKALQYVEMQQPFDQDDEFRKASINYFSSQIDIYESEFAELMRIYSLPTEEITMKSQFQWDSVMNRMIERDSVITETFLEEQREFADRYGITLREID
jgi:hypothetical protein